MLLPTFAPKAIPQPWYVKKKTLQEELNQLAYEEEQYAQETEMALLTGSYDDNNNTNNRNNTNNNNSMNTHHINTSTILDSTTPITFHQQQPLEFQHPMTSPSLSIRNDSVIQPMDDTPIINYSTDYLEEEQNEFDHSPINYSPNNIRDDDDGDSI